MRLLYGQTVIGGLKMRLTVQCQICEAEDAQDVDVSLDGAPFSARLPQGWTVLNMGAICPRHLVSIVEAEPQDVNP